MEREAKALLVKYLNGDCDAAEIVIVERWYNQLKDDVAINEARVDEIGHAIWAQLAVLPSRESENAIKKPMRLWRFTVIAAAIAAITLGVWLYYISTPLTGISEDLQRYSNDVAPGKNVATLTMGNGSVIQLKENHNQVVVNETSLKYDDQSLISAIPNAKNDKAIIQNITAATPRGGTYQVILPDGTKVWLNADSKLIFPSKFVGNERRVKLSGEAYFEVIHNARQPFKVESSGQVVEDLGTAFNINAYPDEAIVKTTLIEGRAAVNGNLLKPNQQSILRNAVVKVITVDPESEVAWKNDDFLFVEQDLLTIMKQLGRWYDVEIDQSNIPSDRHFTGSISRDVKLSEVLRMLEVTGKIRFKIEDKTIVIVNTK
jgi:transmembrane sensor